MGNPNVWVIASTSRWDMRSRVTLPQRSGRRCWTRTWVNQQLLAFDWVAEKIKRFWRRPGKGLAGFRRGVDPLGFHRSSPIPNTCRVWQG